MWALTGVCLKRRDTGQQWAQRKGRVRTQQEGDHPQAKIESSGETDSAATLILGI